MARYVLLLALATGVAACGSGTPPLEHEAALLSLHQTIMTAHLDGDVEPWLAVESDDYVSVNRGEITFPTKRERRAARAPYLESTMFDVYRDLREPIVVISSDGTLGWVIAEVEGAGIRTSSSGEAEPVKFVFAWIELYRRQGGEWTLVGNVSNRRPPTPNP